MRSNYESEQEILEVHARSYQSYTSDYKNGLDGTFGARHEYLNAKNKIEEIESEYKALHVHYALMYDQVKLLGLLSGNVTNSYLNIRFKYYQEEIDHYHTEIKEKERKSKYLFAGLLKRYRDAKVTATDNSIGSSKSAKLIYTKEIDHIDKMVLKVKSLQRMLEDSTDNKKNFNSVKFHHEIQSLVSSAKATSTEAYLVTDISLDLHGYHGLFEKVKKVRSVIKKHIADFFDKTSTLIKDDILKIKHQKLHLSDFFTHSDGDKNPFTSYEHILNRLNSIFLKKEHAKSAQNLKGMTQEADAISKGFTNATLKFSTPALENQYKSAKRTWNNANANLEKYKKELRESAAAYRNSKICPIPMNERYSKTSSYGYSIMYLEEYRRTMASLNMEDGHFQHYSQSIFTPPKRVDTSVLMPSWEAIQGYKNQLQQEIDTRYAAITAVTLAGFVATASLGITLPLLTLATNWLISVNKKISKLKYVEIPQSIEIYHHYAHELPVQQFHKNEIWRNKIVSSAESVIQEIEHKKLESMHQEHLSLKHVKQQVDNMELLIKTMDKVASKKKGEKTHSFIS